MKEYVMCIIAYILNNFPAVCLLIAVLATFINYLFKKPFLPSLLNNFLLYVVFIYYFYNFIMHVFLGDMVAHFIGWPQSPFQAEVGYASLGFALVGLYAYFRPYPAKVCAIVGPACFLWGAAIGHIYQIIHAHNFAPGNAGSVLYTDIIIPFIGFGILWAGDHKSRLRG
jgi:hypothetical protein